MKTTRHLLPLFAAILFLARGGLAEEQEIVTTPDWKLERIWKSAADGGKYHFYDGNLGLRNLTDKRLENLYAEITLLDPQGKQINEKTKIFVGIVLPKETAQRKFEIKPAVQFSELVMKVKYAIEGAEKTVEFTSADGTQPQAMNVGPGILELRVLSHEIEQTILGDKTGVATLVVRVRNLARIPAGQPKARLDFVVDATKYKVEKKAPDTKSKKKKSKKKAEAEEKTPPPPAKTAIISHEFVLDEGEVPGGETKLYKVKLGKKIPEYLNYSLTVSANWPDLEVVQPAQNGAVKTEGEGDKISLGDLAISDQPDGTCALEFPITNTGAPLEANTLIVTFVFFDKAEKEIKKIEHKCAEAFPTGATVKVKIAGQKLPAYESYRFGLKF